MKISALEKALAAAWERKKPLLPETQALRLLNAHASGTPRLVFELYGQHGILYDYGTEQGTFGENDSRKSLRAAAAQWCSAFGWESVSLLDRARAGEDERSGNHVLAGEPPESLVVRENALRFRVEPRHPRNVGLFLDTRMLRADLHARMPLQSGARVLNLFAYTGSLGLAALAGAAPGSDIEVTQVDISARYLDWGRENLRLNNLPEDRCRFSRMDSERYLDWAAKKNLFFDHIILDPPVFSRFEGKVFRWAEDYFRLTEKCAALLSPAGVLHAVTNYAGITAPEFSAGLLAATQGAGRKTSKPVRIPLPPDFDLPENAEDLPEGNAVIFHVTVD
jgi:23S rRNA (cytosine1962-C5)-methyltransferase